MCRSLGREVKWKKGARALVQGPALTHCTEKLVPSLEREEGRALVAPVLVLTIVIS